MANIITGKEISAAIREEIKAGVQGMSVRPGLAVVLVGDDPASAVYVRNKSKACAEVGIYSEVYRLPEETGREQLVGKIMIGNYDFLPCTPAGVMELLHRSGIEVSGKECVVIGRSNIVGKPQAMLLLHENATVTVCHSKTRDLPSVCRRADILVSAVGKAKFVTADMVRNGAVVIDVGMNRDENGKLCGDVDFEPVSEKASYITPVPGGVGPMTITMLLKNTVTAAKRAEQV